VKRRLIWFGREPRGRVRHLVVGPGATPICGRDASDHMEYGWHETRTHLEFGWVMRKPVCKGCKVALIEFGTAVALLMQEEEGNQ